MAVRSVHLTRGRNTAENPFTVDDALVDVGAASRQEVERLGVQVLSPVTLTKRVRLYGEGSGHRHRRSDEGLPAPPCSVPWRSGTLARGHWSSRLLLNSGWVRPDCLRQLVTLGPFDQVLLVDGQPDSLGRNLEPQPSRLPPSASMREVLQLSLPARFTDTPVETVSLADVVQIQQRVAQWIGGTESQDRTDRPGLQESSQSRPIGASTVSRRGRQCAGYAGRELWCLGCGGLGARDGQATVALLGSSHGGHRGQPLARPRQRRPGDGHRRAPRRDRVSGLRHPG